MKKKYLWITISFIVFFHSLFSQTTKLGTFETDALGGLSSSVTLNGKLYFTAYDSIHGRELWTSDGTLQGTHMVKDINPGIFNGMGDFFDYYSVIHNGELYFRGDDGFSGIELWRTDGTEIGTVMVKDINPGNSGSNPGEFASAGANIFFTANTGTQLWRSDGTASGTVYITSFNYLSQLTGFNGNLYFAADPNNTGQELWKCNGTTFNTSLLKDLNGAVGASLPCNFYPVDNLLFFTANTNSGWELWKTNGTNAGTVEVLDINPGGANGLMSVYSDIFMNNIGDTIYFRADDGISGYQLWKSDGTASGTVKLSNLSTHIDAYSRFPIINGKVLFSNYTLSKFWEYDPFTNICAEGNYPFYDYFNNYINKYLFAGNQMFFAGKDSLYGPELWVADGTPSGIRRVQETHLVDNWWPTGVQGFNYILGKTGNHLLFAQARGPYNTKHPLFEINYQNTVTCFAPSVIVPVPLSNTSAHLVWNRTDSTSLYQVRYQETGGSTWITDSTDKSYFAFQNLDSLTDYLFQLKSFCNGSWTDWSDTIFYNTEFRGNQTYTNVLAERAEDSTIVRIYWLRSNAITQVQFRYREYGTTTWNTVSNANGYRRITGLTPSTFYEYTYRENYSGSWGQWYFGSLFFATPGSTSTSIQEIIESNSAIRIFPNPASEEIQIEGDFNYDGYSYSVFNSEGKLVLNGKLKTDQKIAIGQLTTGWYGLQIEKNQIRFASGFLKD